ncbi:hypothetical protein EYF80_009342 [Liparis tanakae]|uniref:Uncharacterized protein n=1 Tax=Liparis tanakae TaxID=230148 RepID=A0A4Z2IRS9_9TELE|nr:hypothetical protein EYF80_009342 [Liparis tanakae]
MLLISPVCANTSVGKISAVARTQTAPDAKRARFLVRRRTAAMGKHTPRNRCTLTHVRNIMLQWRLTKNKNLTLLQRMLPKGHNSPMALLMMRGGKAST